MHSPDSLPSLSTEKAVDLAEGRSWGGKKVLVNIAHFSSNRGVRGEQERSREAWKDNSQSLDSSEMLPTTRLSETEKVRPVEGKMKG